MPNGCDPAVCEKPRSTHKRRRKDQIEYVIEGLTAQVQRHQHHREGLVAQVRHRAVGERGTYLEEEEEEEGGRVDG